MDIIGLLEEQRDADAVAYINDMALDADAIVGLWTRFDSGQRRRLKAAAKATQPTEVAHG